MLKCKKRIFCQWKEAIVLGQKHVSDEAKDTLLRNVSDEAKDTLLRNVPDEAGDSETWFAQYTLLGKAGNCADKDKDKGRSKKKVRQLEKDVEN